MNTDKIVGYMGLLIAILVGVELVAIPYAALLLLISGFVLGYYTPSEAQVRVLISAVALTMFDTVLAEIPEIGIYLKDIVANIAISAQGAALLIIMRNLYKRLKP